MDESAGLRAEQAEVREALEAIGTAMYRVNEALVRLRSAHRLGTVDTWFGGGLFTSLIKRDDLDRADVSMKNVDLALAAVRQELADIGVQEPAGVVGVSPLHRTLDVWFDNIISDLSTQRRIRSATERVEALASALTRVQSELGRRDRELTARLALETEP
jgi:hypothetical protein